MVKLFSGPRDGSAVLLPVLLGSLSFGMLTFVLPIYGKRLGAGARFVQNAQMGVCSFEQLASSYAIPAPVTCRQQG